MCPIVPTFTCGLLLSYFCFAIDASPSNNESVSYLFQNFLRHRLCNRRIVIKFHAGNTASLCGGTQICCIAKHFAQRNMGTDSLSVTRAQFHTLDAATTTVQLTNHIAEVIIRYDNFNFHNWLKQDRRTLLDTFLEG